MKTTMKIAVLAMMGMSLEFSAQHNYDNQNIIYSKENKVGIGVKSPYSSLDVRGNISATGSEKNKDSYVSQLNFINYYTTTLPMASIGVKTRKSEVAAFDYTNIVFETSNGFNTLSEKMRIADNGNVGIGINNPKTKLDVRGNISLTGSEKNKDSYVSQLNFINHYTTTAPMASIGVKTRKSIVAAHDYTNIIFETSNGFDTLSEKMRISDNGNVGIGTTQPDMKLTVNGKIHAKEVKIDLDVPAPDYVFKSNYNLRSIEDVESFIKANSHLPEIPSAKEFAKNGVMQAEMDMNLLKKIEELTLYTIAQEKEIKKEKAENEKQQKEIDELKALVQKLLKDKK